MTPSTFFRPSPVNLTLVNLGGGKADSGFRAVVASLIDNGMEQPHAKINQRALLRLHKAHARYFSSNSPATFADLKAWMAIPAKRQQLIMEWGVTLKELANEEVRTQDLEAYRRFPLADETYLLACAHVLQYPVDIKVYRQDKVLFARLVYGQEYQLNDREPKLCLQWDQQEYRAYVKHPERFTGADKSQDVQPREFQVLLTTFTEIKQTLTQWVEEEGVSFDQLLQVYAQVMPHHRKPEGSHQRLFATFFPNNAPGSYTQRVAQDIIHALSSAISLGEVTQETVLASCLQESSRSQKTP